MGLRLLAGLVTILIACAPFTNVSAQQDPDDVKRYVWDLSALYPDNASWEAERTVIKRNLATIGRLKGTLGRNAKSLADAMDEIVELRRRAGRMGIYGNLLSDADTRSEDARVKHEVGNSMEKEVEEAVRFAADELRAIGAKRMEQFFRQEPRLKIHKWRINQMLRESGHILSAEAQSVARGLERWRILPNAAYRELVESDLGWRTIRDASGNNVTVNRSEYERLVRTSNPNEQMAATEAFLGRLRQLENVFGLLLTHRIEADATIARHRRFADGIDALLFNQGMPRAAQRNLVEVTRANLGTVHRYFELRRRALGLERLTYNDLFIPPPSGNRRFTVKETFDNTVSAMAPLGADYQAQLRELLKKPLMHLPPSPEKRENYAVYPPVGGANAYLFMKYRGDLRTSRSLAGAIALLMKGDGTPREFAQDSLEEDIHTGIYDNAFLDAARFLYDDYLTDQASSEQERFAMLIASLDRLTNNYLRHVLASEFEAKAQDMILKGDAPTGKQLSQIYLDLLRQYYGHDKNIVTVDDTLAAQWMNIAVSFSSFEGLNFSFANAVACILVEKVRAGDAEVRKAFYRGRGNESDNRTSYGLLKQIGIDAAGLGPYQAVFHRMNFLLDELERMLKDKQG